jgi:hypothetical protein
MIEINKIERNEENKGGRMSLINERYKTFRNVSAFSSLIKCGLIIITCT